jgi:hypothetical protein
MTTDLEHVTIPLGYSHGLTQTLTDQHTKKYTSETLSVQKKKKKTRNKTHCNPPDSTNKLNKPQFIQSVLH